MESSFTNGGTIKDVIGHDAHHGISHKFHVFVYILPLLTYLFNSWENWT
jgi:hypothetical protein